MSSQNYDSNKSFGSWGILILYSWGILILYFSVWLAREINVSFIQSDQPLTILILIIVVFFFIACLLMPLESIILTNIETKEVLKKMAEDQINSMGYQNGLLARQNNSMEYQNGLLEKQNEILIKQLEKQNEILIKLLENQKKAD